MSDWQKVLFRQLQLVILGIVILVGGVLANHTPFIIVGIVVLVFGIVRYWSFAKLIKKMQKENEEDQN